MADSRRAGTRRVATRRAGKGRRRAESRHLLAGLVERCVVPLGDLSDLLVVLLRLIELALDGADVERVGLEVRDRLGHAVVDRLGHRILGRSSRIRLGGDVPTGLIGRLRRDGRPLRHLGVEPQRIRRGRPGPPTGPVRGTRGQHLIDRVQSIADIAPGLRDLPDLSGIGRLHLGIKRIGILPGEIGTVSRRPGPTPHHPRVGRLPRTQPDAVRHAHQFPPAGSFCATDGATVVATTHARSSWPL
jgi:hypothetical protein